MNTKNILFPLIFMVSIFLNVYLGIMLFRQPQPDVAPPQLSSETLAPPSEDVSKYPFLSKRIFAEKQNDILVNFIPLRTALREYLNSVPDEVGVYFEYLPSGTSIGVNEKLELRLASLIKTPLVMGVYKQIEKGSLQAEAPITIKKEDLDMKFGTLWKKGEGAKLTVKEAVDLALIKSDNTAANMLLSVVPMTAIDEVFDSLDISTNNSGEVNLISPKSYSSIFRSLYLSSSLNRDSSNEMLDILARTDFTDQIVAGVPSTVKVSHKIGVYSSENARSDCGIVYVPDRPYLLCIMAKANEEKSREYMKHISKMIYGYITIAE